jgi:hypothetical protein
MVILRDESTQGLMQRLSIGKQMRNVPIHEVVPEFMAYREALKTFTRKTSAVENAEVISNLHHASGDPAAE